MLSLLYFLGWLAASGLAIISTTANFRFGTLLTTGDERWLYGAIFGLLDCLKIVLLPLAGYALATGQRSKAVAAVLFFVLLSALSFTASIGLYATTKSATVGDAKAARERYSEAKGAKESADSAIEALPPTRPPTEIEAEIAATKRDAVYDRSKQCTDATLPASRKLCETIDRLDGELGRARERQRLEQKAAEAALALDKQDVAAAMRAIDPQAETLAKLIEPVCLVSADTVRTMLAVFIGLLIELGSGLGPWLVAPSARKCEPDTAQHELQTSAALEAAVAPLALEAETVEEFDADEQVEQWAGGALVYRRGSHLPAAEVRAAYERHCEAVAFEGLTANAFGRAMTRAGYSRGKVGGTMRYENVAFAVHGRPQLRLAASGGAVPQFSEGA